MEATGVQFANILAGPDMIVILLLGLVLFGGKKIGDLGKGLGEGIRNFKTAMKEEEPKVDEKKIEETKQA